MENKDYIYRPVFWTKERNQWLIENTKGMSRKDAYDLWCKTFPDTHKTELSVNNQRSRLKCASFIRDSVHSTKTKPLYSERLKSGYPQIKVAMPNVWWPKSKWVWINTHPEELNTLEQTDAFYFADGNISNMDPDNILRVHRREQTAFIFEGGIVPGDPELSKIHLLLARMKLARLDAAEKCGDVVTTQVKGRVIRVERNAKAREYRRKKYLNDEAYRNKIKQQHKRYYANLSEEKKAKKREYTRQWARNKREKEKQNENKIMQETRMQQNSDRT